jgi:hypothetical protein
MAQKRRLSATNARDEGASSDDEFPESPNPKKVRWNSVQENEDSDNESQESGMSANKVFKRPLLVSRIKLGLTMPDFHGRFLFTVRHFLVWLFVDSLFIRKQWSSWCCLFSLYQLHIVPA